MWQLGIIMKVVNYFSLKSLLKLYKQLYHQDDSPFSTVGEVIKWRNLIVENDELEAARVWEQIEKRRAWLDRVTLGEIVVKESAVLIVESQISDLRDAQHRRQQLRMADIRAINQFLDRCGLSI
jgi:hypothetical protein